MHAGTARSAQLSRLAVARSLEHALPDARTPQSSERGAPRRADQNGILLQSLRFERQHPHLLGTDEVLLSAFNIIFSERPSRVPHQIRVTKRDKCVTAMRDARIVDSDLLALRSVSEGRISREAEILVLRRQLLVLSRRRRKSGCGTLIG